MCFYPIIKKDIFFLDLEKDIFYIILNCFNVLKINFK